MTLDAPNQKEKALLSLPRQSWFRGLSIVLVAVLVLCVFKLETRTNGLSVESYDIGAVPITVYKPQGPGPYPTVVIAHGFGGSRQMMDQIAITLARSGFLVANMDFPGHGRNPELLSTDVTRIEGTTTQLVASVRKVADAIIQRLYATGPFSFVSHSMATDVVVRASDGMSNVGAIVAISKYSEAVTADHPKDLIVISGATERRLRGAALEALRLLDPDAEEGVTITTESGLARRAVVAPLVGHVGVLYSPTTLQEARDWIIDRKGVGSAGHIDNTGWIAGLVIVCLVFAAWPLSRFIPVREAIKGVESERNEWLAVTAPAPFAIGAAVLVPGSAFGYSGFPAIAAFFAAWGIAQIAVLKWRKRTVFPPDQAATVLLLAWGIGVFGLALDRYGAAFVLSEPRLGIMPLVLIGTVPFMMADASVVAGRSWWFRIVARIPVFIALSAAMALAPRDLALAFTVLPVLLLFYIVYGTFARLINQRRGAGAANIGMGIALAWAIAASTPLFGA